MSVLSGLSANDLNALMVATEEMVASTDLDRLRQTTVEALAGVVGSPLVAWNEVCPRTGRIEAVTFPQLDPAVYKQLGEVFATHVEDHPVIAHHRSTSDSRPWAISDFVSLSDFRRTGLYSDFYRPLGATDQLSFILPDKDLIIGIALNTADGAITDRERTLCGLIQPVLLQSYRHLRAQMPDEQSIVSFLEHRGLTPREVAVMMLVRDSASTKQISAQLSISPCTVEKHVEHALMKLGMTSRLQASALLNRWGGLVPRPEPSARAALPLPPKKVRDTCPLAEP
jgi:DNA-binding CsgD family transcriptional regulator